MKLKEQIVLIIAMLFLPMAARASNTVRMKLDGICYLLDEDRKLARVTNNPDGYSASVVIPPTVSYLGVTYNVYCIDWMAFAGCTGLTSVTIPNSVTFFQERAFSGCTGLTSVNIPNSVTSIGHNAFNGCSSLTSITIPNSVKSIGDAAFWGCKSLTSITIPNSVTSIGATAFAACHGLTSIIIPNSVTSIREYTFSGCIGLTFVTIPNSVTSIGDLAFSLCTGLVSVVIPNSVTSIGHKVFSDCEQLKEFRSKIKNPFPINADVFSKNLYDDTDDIVNILPDDATLYVPKGTKAKYEATEGWKVFPNIVEMEPVVIEGDLNGDEEVDVTDVVELIDMVLAGSNDPAGDINGDGEVDVTDVVELIDMVLAGE